MWLSRASACDTTYCYAFETFWERLGKGINPKTTVLLLSDPRNNYHGSQACVLQERAKKASPIYWLNPEPRSHWDPGDSILSQYATFGDGAYERGIPKQLERMVETLGSVKCRDATRACSQTRSPSRLCPPQPPRTLAA